MHKVHLYEGKMSFIVKLTKKRRFMYNVLIRERKLINKLCVDTGCFAGWLKECTKY